MANQFKIDFPDSPYDIDSLIHEIEYVLVKDSNTITSFLGFLQRHPVSIYKNEMRDKLNALQELDNKQRQNEVFETVNHLIKDQLPQIELNRVSKNAPYSIFLNDLYTDMGLFSLGNQRDIELFKINNSFRIVPWSGSELNKETVLNYKLEGVGLSRQIISGQFFTLSKPTSNNLKRLGISLTTPKRYGSDNITYHFDEIGNIVFYSSEFKHETNYSLNIDYNYNVNGFIDNAFIRYRSSIQNRPPLYYLYNYTYNSNNKLESIFSGFFVNKYNERGYVFQIEYNNDNNITLIRKSEFTWIELFNDLNIVPNKTPSVDDIRNIPSQKISEYSFNNNSSSIICEIKYNNDQTISSINKNGEFINFYYYSNAVVALRHRRSPDFSTRLFIDEVYHFLGGDVFLFSDDNLTELSSIYSISTALELIQESAFEYLDDNTEDIDVVRYLKPNTKQEQVIFYSQDKIVKKQDNSSMSNYKYFNGDIWQIEHISNGLREKHIYEYQNNSLSEINILMASSNSPSYTLSKRYSFWSVY
ncbi:hypothetical protein QA597_10560 [Marinilabiliaceae bacterium ANBcel2]|nr:hypothetical protein [Marinilabiliaceae bacterium ANBcel2]